jgi:hypothetical protein
VGPSALAWGVLVPALAAGAILALGWKFLWKHPRERGNALAERFGSRALGALAVATATFAACCLLFDWPATPRESWHWLAWAAPAFAVLAVVEQAARLPQLARWLVRSAVLAAALRGMFASRFAAAAASAELPSPWPGLLLDDLRILLLWAVWGELLLRRLGAALGAVLLWVVLASEALLALFSASARVAQMLGAACAGVGAVAVLCLLRPTSAGAEGALAVAIPLLGLSTVNVCGFASPVFGLDLYLLLALAPLLPLAVEEAGVRPRSPLTRGALLVAISLAPIVWALVHGQRVYGES